MESSLTSSIISRSEAQLLAGDPWLTSSSRSLSCKVLLFDFLPFFFSTGESWLISSSRSLSCKTLLLAFLLPDILLLFGCFLSSGTFLDAFRFFLLEISSLSSEVSSSSLTSSSLSLLTLVLRGASLLFVFFGSATFLAFLSFLAALLPISTLSSEPDLLSSLSSFSLLLAFALLAVVRLLALGLLIVARLFDFFLLDWTSTSES